MINKLINSLIKRENVLIEFINASLLEEEIKNKFKALIIERIGRLK